VSIWGLQPKPLVDQNPLDFGSFGKWIILGFSTFSFFVGLKFEKLDATFIYVLIDHYSGMLLTQNIAIKKLGSFIHSFTLNPKYCH
jgi:hypothetical protein